MSIDHLATLMAECTGAGCVVACRPASPDDGAFYVGTTRAPVPSFHEALLLALGGKRADGQDRYTRILVVSAGMRNVGRCVSERPSEAGLKFTTDHVDRWSAWWFRPGAASVGAAPSAPGRATRADFGLEPRRPPPTAAAEYPPYPDQPTQGVGAAYVERIRWFVGVVDRLAGAEPSLLLVEADFFDYDVSVVGYALPAGGSSDASSLRARLAGDGLAVRGRSLDVVLFSRRSETIDRLLRTGLPRPPDNGTPDPGTWPVFTLKVDHELTYPNGRMPWDAFLGQRDGLAGRPDETLADRVLSQGLSTRVTAPPPRPAAGGEELDLEFWRSRDPDTIEHELNARYFGATEHVAVRNLLDAMRRLQKTSQVTENVVKDWFHAATVLFYGEAGQGKTMLATELSRAIFGRDPLMMMLDGQPAEALKWAFGGSTTGFRDSGTLTSFLAQVQQSRGFTVILFDELDKVVDNRGGRDGMSRFDPFTTLLSARKVQVNSGLSQPFLSIANAIIVFTSNDRSTSDFTHAFRRRVSAIEFRAPDAETILDFTRWRLLVEVRRAAPDKLCLSHLALDDVRGIPMSFDSFDEAEKSWSGLVRVVEDETPARAAGSQSPVFDATDLLRGCIRDYLAGRR